MAVTPCTDTPPILAIERLRLQFGTRKILNSVSLDVREGEVVVLLGSSGSGKTSLLRCINLLNKPTHGRITIDGETIFHTSLGGTDEIRLSPAAIGKIRAKTGMVFQQFNLFPHMSVLRNVLEAPVIVGRRPHDEARAQALALLRRFGLEEHAEKTPAQLSGGQQQRVAIARALAMTPRVMLFDEPTSALDPELVGDVLQTMIELARGGMTMLVVTHEIGFAFAIADRVIFLDQGDIIADGRPVDVLLHPQHPKLRNFVARFHESADMFRPFLAAKCAP